MADPDHIHERIEVCYDLVHVLIPRGVVWSRNGGSLLFRKSFFISSKDAQKLIVEVMNQMNFLG